MLESYTSLLEEIMAKKNNVTIPAADKTLSADKAAGSDKSASAGGFVAEADFDDTIARNRALPLLDPATVPRPPADYRPTDPEMANRRIRRLAAEHRSEACDALREAMDRDLREDLGKHAPDPKRAPALLERLIRSEQLVIDTQRLVAYAREMDRLALSDAYLFLNAEKDLLEGLLKHEPELESRYPKLQKLFAARSGAIVEGMIRAKEATVQAPADKPPAK
jgi:hypothetical protein